MKIHELDFSDIHVHGFPGGRPRLTLVAGENGAGKSRALRIAAEEAVKYGKSVIAVSNSNFDRFKNLKGVQVLSPRLRESSPEKVLKRAIASSQTGDEILLRHIARTIQHCHYVPQVGIKVTASPFWARRHVTSDLYSLMRDKVSLDELSSVDSMIKSGRLDEVEWLSFDGYSYDYSVDRNLATVIKWEKELKELGAIRDVKLFLRRYEQSIELTSASSGELSLITSMAFIAASKDANLIVIDEPENSLHPHWQRQYINLLLGITAYRDLQLIVATHSPLIVLGAEDEDDAEVIVLRPQHESGVPKSTETELKEEGLEAVMAEVFQTITPKNHYLSRKLVGLLDDLEEGRVGMTDFTDALSEIRGAGIDSRQSEALFAVEKMAREIIEK